MSTTALETSEDREAGPGWWARVRHFFGVLVLVRFSVITTVVVVAGLVFLVQAQEVLRATGEFEAVSRGLTEALFLVLGALVCAFSVWYCARVLLFVRFANPASAPDAFPRFKRELPRWLGFLVLAGTAAAVYRSSLESDARWVLVGLAGVLGGLSILFVLFTMRRRAWLGLTAYAAAPRGLSSWIRLPAATLAVFAALLALDLALMVAFIRYPHLIAGMLGTGAVALLAAALTVPVGTLLVYFGNRVRIPVLTLVVLLALVFSLNNDNHRVRQHPGMRSFEDFSQRPENPGPLAEYADLERYFQAWVADLRALHPEGEPVPVFVVAAEGGGIRAAYWTGLVLAELQDRARAAGRDFARHVFAISGVSGGALGGAVFAALGAGAPGLDLPADCGDRCRASRMLSGDFLAPTVATLLFPDLLQRFLPAAVLDDRAMALERAFERRWRTVEGTDRFASAYLDLWEKADFSVPLLLLNATAVETGQRVIVNPLSMDEGHFSRSFADALDARRLLGDELALSTAVHLGARFTYVSPAGSIQVQQPTGGAPAGSWLRVVDGGYFENAGAVTASEVLARVQEAAVISGVNVHPVIIQISNVPLQLPGRKEARRRGERVFMGETLSPVRALLQVRAARGFQARDALAWQVTSNQASGAPGSHIHFQLCQREVELPLNWMLSGHARAELHAQLGGEPEARTRPAARHNGANIERVVSLLADGGDSSPAEAAAASQAFEAGCLGRAAAADP